MIRVPKKGGYIKFKKFQQKRKSPCMIYLDFESIAAPENNGKQNLKHVACSHGYKLLCVDDKF